MARGERFEFGKNWSRFLRVLNEDRIGLAEGSLRAMLETERLDGLTFLDVGSGSGLFSLSARRLGATVHSFDYDPQSVACTRELKRRYLDGDPGWTVEQGSVLDQSYLGRLGTFDIVYSWGVLHHTGQMRQALDNVKPLAKMGGRLFIAIYNDQGAATDRWAGIKQTYVKLPAPAASLYALAIITAAEARRLAGDLRHGQPGAWLQSWREYAQQSTRGMSKWHDCIDWIGGYPYERATIEQIVDRCGKVGYRLVNLVDRSNGYGCNEFVFSRDSPLGTWIDSPIPGGSSLVRRFGRRVVPPFHRTSDGWVSAVEQRMPAIEDRRVWLFKAGELLEPTRFNAGGCVVVAPSSADGTDLDETPFHLVAGEIRLPSFPFDRVRGHMWSWEANDLEDRADTLANSSRSTVFVLQDGRQLEHPHALHDEIARRGDGRFSHWGSRIYFAPRGNQDPRKQAERFTLFIPASMRDNDRVDQAAAAASLANSGAGPVDQSRRSPRGALPARFPGVYAAGSELVRRNLHVRRLQPFLDNRERSVLSTLSAPGDFPFRLSRVVEGRVLLGSGTLDGGGAERQIVNTMEGLRARGVDDVHLLVEYLDTDKGNAFYLDKATKAAASIVRPADRQHGTHAWTLQHPEFRVVVSDWLANQILKDAETIRQLSPEIVQCSLDWPNITIGMAAVLAGVPNVFISGRNLGPRYFAFFQWFMYPSYRALAAHPSVTLLNNSKAGCEDYARWLRLPPQKIRVVRNGLHAEEFRPVSDDVRAAARRELGLDAGAKVVVGAFRLSGEKRPLLWVEAAARIKAKIDGAVFLHCGAGPMQARVEARVHRLGLDGSVRFLGLRKDIQTIFATADVVLLTSLQEGTPNTLIEAQAMGIPVVTTPACGAAEAVEHGVTGIVVRDETARGLAATVLDVLADPAMAVRVQRAGPAFIESRFGLRRMVDDTLSVYADSGVAWAAGLLSPRARTAVPTQTDGPAAPVNS